MVRISPLLIFVATVLLAAGAAAQAAQAAPDHWKTVEQAMQRPGQAQSGEVFKFSLPRRDLHVTINGVEVKPGFGLGSWVAFKDAGARVMVMGDLVLAENEVEPVMAKLLESGIEITALHNHLLGESPRVMYMHIGGHGDGATLARSIHDALKLTATPEAASPGAAASPGIEPARIESTLGFSGKVNGGILQFSVPRAETITMGAQVIPPSMGVATAINFEPAGSGQAAITGDFVLLAGEVNPVLAALRRNGIDVAAVHSHMLEESPRLFFVHFWAHGDAAKLAQGLRAALERTNSAKPPSK